MRGRLLAIVRGSGGRSCIAAADLCGSARQDHDPMISGVDTAGGQPNQPDRRARLDRRHQRGATTMRVQ